MIYLYVYFLLMLLMWICCCFYAFDEFYIYIIVVRESHPFCLKMLPFVWVTCRWSWVVGGGSTSRTCYVWDGILYYFHSYVLNFETWWCSFVETFWWGLCAKIFIWGLIMIEMNIPLQIFISWLLNFNSLFLLKNFI